MKLAINNRIKRFLGINFFYTAYLANMIHRGIASLGILTLVVFWTTLASPLTQAQPFAYVTNVDSGTVLVIDTATNAVVDTITVGNSPFGVAITHNGSHAYVTNVTPWKRLFPSPNIPLF